ncbi:MAG: glycosyltransferase [Bacteroidales bacterium]|nr:glycosyltransferase [Bacteroidales bacterium]
MRGGIAQFNADLYDELGKSHTVKAFTFSRQYPQFLFPGKTQYVTPDDNTVPVDSEAVLDTANPLSYPRAGRKVRKWKPDILVMKYWMSYFAPSLGSVARAVRKDGCRVISILDNVVPHERRFFDTPLTKYFLSGCSGHVAMCREVADDLLSLSPEAKYTILPHPLYNHFGDPVPREEAEDRLGLPHGKRNILFFGLIRDYKGLDILLDAFSLLDDSHTLVVAGEPYGSFEKYERIVEASPARDRIRLFPRYIPDSEVKDFFSAADVTVLPYRSATQSGISSIAYNFEVPLIVTDTGGLRGAVGDTGTGLVADKADSGAIAAEINRFFSDPAVALRCKENIRKEKERLSWGTFARNLVGFAQTL